MDKMQSCAIKDFWYDIP